MTATQVDYCRGRAGILAINDNYRLAPWADWLYACDYDWWKYHAQRMRETFTGQCWTRDPEAAKDFGLEWIRSSPTDGLSPRDDLIYEGCNSGYQAINLAFHFGARKIVLIGYDMGATGDSHWFGDHPSEIHGARDFNAFLAGFPALASDLQRQGVEVINCTTTTALKCFQRAHLEDTL